MRCTMTGYHDYVLGLIPAALLGTTLLLEGLGWSMQVAVPIGGATATALVAHAMFVRGPTTDSVVPDSPARSTGHNAGPNGGPPANAD